MNEIGTPLEEPDVVSTTTPGEKIVAPSEPTIPSDTMTTPPEAATIPAVTTAPRVKFRRRFTEHASPRMDVALSVILDGFLIAVVLIVNAGVEALREVLREALRVHLHIHSDDYYFVPLEIILFVGTAALVILYMHNDFIALRDRLRERRQSR